MRRLPLRGKPAKRRQRREKRAGFEEAARLAAPSGAGNRPAATVWVPPQAAERWLRRTFPQQTPLRHTVAAVTKRCYSTGQSSNKDKNPSKPFWFRGVRFGGEGGI